MNVCAELNHDISAMDDKQLLIYNNNNTKYGYVITNILAYTTYAKNTGLSKIVHALDQMTGSDAIYDVEIDPALIEKLNYLSHHLDSEETIQSVWNQLLVLLEEKY